jgi:hypothetical protein
MAFSFLGCSRDLVQDLATKGVFAYCFPGVAGPSRLVSSRLVSSRLIWISRSPIRCVANGSDPRVAALITASPASSKIHCAAAVLTLSFSSEIATARLRLMTRPPYGPQIAKHEGHGQRDGYRYMDIPERPRNVALLIQYMCFRGVSGLKYGKTSKEDRGKGSRANCTLLRVRRDETFRKSDETMSF